MLLSSTHYLVVSRSCSFLAYPFNRSVVSSIQVLFILSSFASLFNWSVVQILSYSLLLVQPEWFRILSCSSCHSYLVFATPKVLWFHSFVKEATLFHLFLFLFLFSFLDLGARSLVSGGELWQPETDAPDAFHVFRIIALIICLLHFIMASFALHRRMFS